MAAVVAVAVNTWKPQIATTAAVVIAYRLLLEFGLADLVQVGASPGTCASLLLGLCVSWAAHTAYTSTGSTPKSSCKDTGATLQVSDGQQTQPQASQQQGHPCMDAADSFQQTFAGSDSSSIRPMRLAEPPFSADLSVPLGSNTRHLINSSCKPRRRRLPRLSIELTPLPRLSVDFTSYRQAYSSSCSRASSIRRSLDRCSAMPGSAADMFSGWGIAEELGSGLAGCGSLQLQQQLPTHAVGEATDSLGLGELAPGVGFIEDVINETHLLQVGAILGEASARGALAAREAGGPVGHPSSFYGSSDTLDHGEPWELLISEGNDNVLYWGWRKPLRKGLYMYMTRSVFLGATPAELRAFMNDDVYRVVWDNSMHVLRPVVSPDPAPAAGHSSGANASTSASNAAVELMAAAAAARISGSGDAERAEPSTASSSAGQPHVLPHESVVMQALVQFPKPMASRSYLYARRVWPRPADGGCYCLSKSCTLPLSTAVPALPGRSVAVDDYSSGCVIRAPTSQLLPPGTDPAAPAAEVFMVYFEDSHVRASLANLGIKKGLWPLVQRTEKALRVYQAGAAANLHLQAMPATTAGAGSSGSSQQDSSSEAEVTSPRPAVFNMSRSASLGSYEMRSASRGVVLSRSASMQEPEHMRRLSSASLPCFPLGPGLDDDETVLQEPCSACSCTGSVGSQPACSTSSSSAGAKSSTGSFGKSAQLLQELEKQDKPKSGRWGWLGRMGSTVCGVIKQSGQLLAAASVVLWRSGGSVSMLLPRFEWKVLNWAYQQISGTRQLLLGAPPAAGAAKGSRLAHVSSHPLSEWTGPGLVSKLTSQVVRRLPSHPLSADDLLAAADNPRTITTVRAEPALQLRMAYAAALNSSNRASSTAGSAVSSTAGSDVASFSLSCSSCGCCCGGSVGGASSSGSSRRCHSVGGSGSLVRDETGGRRHRRVVVKLVQTAGLRMARRMARLAGINE